MIDRKLETPILALGGDAGMSPHFFDAMRPLASSVVGGIVENCGHYMPEEQPEIIAQRILDFLDS